MKYTLFILIMFGIASYYIAKFIPDCIGSSVRIGRGLVTECSTNEAFAQPSESKRFGRVIIR